LRRGFSWLQVIQNSICSATQILINSFQKKESMFKVPFIQVKDKILRSGKITEEQLMVRVKEKINELSGLITEEGAAHIIANELGVELVSQNERLKVKEIYPGMRDVTTAGKVLRLYEERRFQKGEKEGKLRSFLLGDETETVRVVLWNDQVSLLQDVQENDVVLLKHAYAKENTNGKELHLGERSELVLHPVGISFPVVREKASFERKSIAALQDTEQGVEILGTIVQVFDPRFFSVCSSCGKKVQESPEGAQCAEHGIVPPGVSYVLNLILDDGTGNIRSVLWKQQVHHLLGKNEAEMAIFRDQPGMFEGIKTDLLGEQVKFLGRVKKNEMFNRPEFTVQIVEKAQPEEEIARLEKMSE